MGIEKPMQVKGKHFILGLLAVAVLSTGAAILYQTRLTRRCLELWGTENVRLIQYSSQVELIEFDAQEENEPQDNKPGAAEPENGDSDELIAGDQKNLEIIDRLDISRARGLIHLRAAMLVDQNFEWDAKADPRPTWKYGLRFTLGPKESLLIPFSGDFQWLSGPGELVVSTGELAGGFAEFLHDYFDEAGHLSTANSAGEAEETSRPGKAAQR